MGFDDFQQKKDRFFNDSGCVQEELSPMEAEEGEGVVDEEEVPGGPELMSLSNEMLLHVFGYCGPMELKALAFTCTRFCSLAQSHHLWVEVVENSVPTGEARLKWMLANMFHQGTSVLKIRGFANQSFLTKTQENDTSGDSGVSNEPMASTSKADEPNEARETSIDTRRIPLRNACHSYLGGGTATILSRNPWYTDYDNYVESRSRHTSLAYTMSPHVMAGLAELRALHTLALEHCNVDCLQTNLSHFPPTIKHLSLRGTKCFNLPFDRSFMFKVDEYLPELQTVDVSLCPWFEGSSLLPLSKCRNLTKVTARCCKRLSEFVAYASLSTRFGFKTLKHLDVRGSLLGDSEVAAFGWLPVLEELYCSPPPLKEDEVVFPENEVEIFDWEVEEEPESFRSNTISYFGRIEGSYKPKTSTDSFKKFGFTHPNTNSLRRPSDPQDPPENKRSRRDSADDDDEQPSEAVGEQDVVEDEDDQASAEVGEQMRHRYRHTFRRMFFYPQPDKTCGHPPHEEDKSVQVSEEDIDEPENVEDKGELPPDEKIDDEPVNVIIAEGHPNFSGQSSNNDDAVSVNNDNLSVKNEANTNGHGHVTFRNLMFKRSSDLDSEKKSETSTPPKKRKLVPFRDESKDDDDDKKKNCGVVNDGASTSKANAKTNDDTSATKQNAKTDDGAPTSKDNAKTDDENEKSDDDNEKSDDENENMNGNNHQDANERNNENGGHFVKFIRYSHPIAMNAETNSHPNEAHVNAVVNLRSLLASRNLEPPLVEEEEANPNIPLDIQNIPLGSPNRNLEPPLVEEEEENPNIPLDIQNIPLGSLDCPFNIPLRQDPNDTPYHVVYVNLGEEAHSVYQVGIENDRPICRQVRECVAGDEGLRHINRLRRPLQHVFVPPPMPDIDPSTLVTDAALWQYGQAQFHNSNYVQIINDENNRRPSRSRLRRLIATGYRGITNASLVHLAVSAPDLVFIDMRGTKVDEKGVQQFKALRPDCEVLYGELES